jgi:NHL repeat
MGVLNSRRVGSGLIVWLLALAGVLVLAASASALEVHAFSNSFGEEGSGNGQLKEPAGLAVNDSTHDVYVADGGNGRVEEFTSGGVYLGQFAPPGGFGGAGHPEPGPNEIAVDNSDNPLDPSSGDVYVVDAPNKAIDKFNASGGYEGALTAGQNGVPFGNLTGVAVDPNGVLWVTLGPSGGRTPPETESFSDARVNMFQSKIVAFGSNGLGLAVDSEGRLYIHGGYNVFVERLVSGEREEILTEGSIGGMGVDSSTNILYLSIGNQVSAFDPKKLFAKSFKETFGAGDLTVPSGVAVDSSTHVVYVADAAADKIVAFGSTVVPDVSTGEEPTGIEHEGGVTLDGVVNPDGIPVTSCEFEYGTETSPYLNTVPCLTESGSSAIGSGQEPVAVHAVVSGLTPLTLYRYRLVAGNANGSDPGSDRTFIALAHPGVSDESASNVSADGATLSGRVNPGGGDTTYRFEYGPSASYGENISGDAGSGTGNVEVDAHLQGLEPGTVYHYRLVAENQLETVVGADHTFSTQSAAINSQLPDARAWEMVSPPDKHSGSLLPVGLKDGALIQAAAAGDAITYVASDPTEAEPPGDRAPEGVQILSERGPGDWATKVIATPHDATHTSLVLGSKSEYQMFSSDLSLALVQPRGSMPLSEETTEQTPYLRHDAECEADPKACYQPLVTAANVEQGVKFGGEPGPEPKDSPTYSQVRVEGASPDLSHVLLQSKVALTSGGTPGLYEWEEGKLTFVGDMNLGYQSAYGNSVRNAVSADGSRVIGTGTSEGLKGLLMRDMATGKTLKLDTAEPGAAGGRSNPVFQTASSDGSRVFFTDEAQLTTDSTAHSEVTKESADLYEFNVETGKLLDLSVDPHSGEHADVQGVIGASEDGSYIYFAASDALVKPAVDGDCDSSEPDATCNIYVRHDGTTKLVAVLSGEDEKWLNLLVENLREVGMRVSQNGLWLAFTSNRSLTGYDNRDALSGKPDEEMFLYNANTGHVVCASCNPTGARPIGEFLTTSVVEGEPKPQPLVNDGGRWENVSIAATAPGWSVVGGKEAVYQSRYLSNSGRLFFDSDDALVPQDTDGTWDVYEYEPPGVGSCSGSGATFSEVSGGCVGLISSGGSSAESLFIDASENGDDVFFLTSAGLAPQDYDGGYDLYDAHVCTTASPCLPAVAVSPPPCTTGDSCKAAPTPQPEIFGAPPSETFSGTGNISSQGVSNARATKALTRAQKLTAALRMCRKKKAKHKRLVCERHAKKQYDGKAARSVAGKSVSSRTGR